MVVSYHISLDCEEIGPFTRLLSPEVNQLCVGLCMPWKKLVSATHSADFVEVVLYTGAQFVLEDV